MNSSIDISWIDQEDEEGVIEKEPMDQIQCYYIYISEEEDDESDRKIKHVIKEAQVLEECPNSPNSSGLRPAEFSGCEGSPQCPRQASLAPDTVLPGSHTVLPGSHTVLPGSHTVLPGSHTGTFGPLTEARLIPHSSKMMGDQGVTQDYRLEHKKPLLSYRPVRLGLHLPEQRKISTGRLLQMIHSKKNPPPTNPNTKYRLMEILLYNVESDVENIQNIDTNILKIVTISEEIIIQPSLCIFHEINSLYFVFQEVEIETYQPKPILKILSDINKGGKKTKKVAFKDQEFRHTKKRLSSPSPPI